MVCTPLTVEKIRHSSMAEKGASLRNEKLVLALSDEMVGKGLLLQEGSAKEPLLAVLVVHIELGLYLDDGVATTAPLLAELVLTLNEELEVELDSSLTIPAIIRQEIHPFRSGSLYNLRLVLRGSPYGWSSCLLLDPR